MYNILMHQMLSLTSLRGFFTVCAMRRRRCAASWPWGLLALALSLLNPHDASAGAWTVPRHRWYTEYFYRIFQSKSTFDADGNSHRRAKAGRFRDIRNELKLEYGVTDALNLLASIPYQSAHHRDDSSGC